MIISPKSEPLFEVEIGKTGYDGADDSYLYQFILYSSLDMINSSVMWFNSSTFLKVIDKFNNLAVSAFATQGGKVFLLLHPQGKSEDAIRSFFIDAHEMYVKYLLNPFTNPDGTVVSPHFTANIRNLCKKYLL